MIERALSRTFDGKLKVRLIRQLLSFGVVGVLNALIYYALYAALVSLKVHPQIANAVAFVLSLLNSFILNRQWTFRRKNPYLPIIAVRFLAVYLANYLVGAALLWSYIDLFHINKYFAPLLCLPLTVPISFLINKKWVFK